MYAAEHNGKAMLYAHDTGFFPEPVWEYFTKTRLRFNLVSLDCTSMIKRDGNNHMGIQDCAEMRQRLVSVGAAGADTVFVLNHFSHNGGLNHDALCAAAGKEGFIVSYDGMEIEA
jgi:phosphoribosyl 1,2-cyclic phosphate phosphodiesterase